MALEAIQELKIISEIGSTYNIHPTQVKNWKKQLLMGGLVVFDQNTIQQQRGLLELPLEQTIASGFAVHILTLLVGAWCC